MKILKNISVVLLILSLLWNIFSLYAADTESDYNDTKAKVLNVQAINSNLPTSLPIDERKWSIGYIMSRLFDNNGKIWNWFLKALGTRSDNAVLRWEWWNGGQFVAGSITDNGTNVWIWWNPTTYSTEIYGTSRFRDTITLGNSSNEWIISFSPNIGWGESWVILQWNTWNGVLIRWNGWASAGLIVRSSWNVGIGTTSPAAKLQVSEGSWGNVLDLRQASNAAGARIRFSDQSSGAQHGFLEYVHSDSQSYGASNAFKLYGSESAMNLHVDWGIITTWNATIGWNLIVTGWINGDQITDGTIDSSEIEDNTITETDISNSFVARNSNLLDGINSTGFIQVNTSWDQIADGTIDSSEIQNNTITASDLAADSVWASELGNNSVASANIVNESVTNADIDDGTVRTQEIANDTITETDISNSFVARNSNLLDGINSPDFLRSNVDDTFLGKLSVWSTNNRRAGIYGTYDSTKVWHIWSMGTSYQIPQNGSNFGNLYGLAYKHTNNTTGGNMAGGHQMVWAQNGTGRSAMGTNIWTSGAYVVDSTTVIDENAWIIGDRISQNSVDSSEIQNNTLTASDLAANSVGNSELIDAPTVTTLYIGTTDTSLFRDTANRIATDDSFYVRSASPSTYLYSTNTYLGNTSGDTTHLRGNNFDWNNGQIQGNGNIYNNGHYMRQSHQKGGFVGWYNNIWANSSNTSPIYSIGTSYLPGSTTLWNHYGVWYSNAWNASFVPVSGGWGMYVAADWDARIFLDASYGRIYASSAVKTSCVGNCY
jgi:hypothetical protein